MRSTARVRSVEVAKTLELTLTAEAAEYRSLPIPNVWLETALREGGYTEEQVDAVMNLVVAVVSAIAPLLKTEI